MIPGHSVISGYSTDQVLNYLLVDRIIYAFHLFLACNYKGPYGVSQHTVCGCQINPPEIRSV